MDVALPDVFTFNCFRAFVKARRIALGLTVRAVSREANIKGETWVSQVERGSRRLLEPQLSKLVRLLRLNAEEERFFRLLTDRDQAPEGPQREALESQVQEALAIHAGRVAADLHGWSICLVQAGVPAPDAVWERARAAQSRAAEVLRQLDGPARPQAKFRGISQATSAAGLALAEDALSRLAEQLLASATPGCGGQRYLAQLEIFPLARVQGVGEPVPTSATATLPSVESHHRADEYLQAWIDAKGWSPSHLAQELGVSPSTVIRALATRHFSKKLEDKICKFLTGEGEFNEEDEALFGLLAERDRVTARAPVDPEGLRVLSESIAHLRVAAERRERAALPEQIQGDWRCAAIADLPVLMPAFADDPAAIGAALDPPISPAEAAEALDRLLRAGLLERSEGGRLSVNPYPTWFRRRAAAGDVERAFLANLRTMAAEGARRLELLRARPAATGASFRTLQLFGGPEQWARWSALLVAGQERLASVLGDQAQRADRVVQVNLQIFPG